ncbi:MAG TPA: hypothetical protein VF623_14040 [Segetibacter sp.]|jgi:sucrose-6-phosphate hydrolase SacC (GH32 family)
MVWYSLDDGKTWTKYTGNPVVKNPGIRDFSDSKVTWWYYLIEHRGLKIFFGWMSNWQYATVVPTGKWRSATTVPRGLCLEKIGNKYVVTSLPSAKLSALNSKPTSLQNILAANFN